MARFAHLVDEDGVRWLVNVDYIAALREVRARQTVLTLRAGLMEVRLQEPLEDVLVRLEVEGERKGR